jgi:hypothetical protein
MICLSFSNRVNKASSLKRLISDDNSDFILQRLNSCNSSLPAISLQYGLNPLKSVASASTLAVKQAFFHGPRPDRPETY